MGIQHCYIIQETQNYSKSLDVFYIMDLVQQLHTNHKTLKINVVLNI